MSKKDKIKNELLCVFDDHLHTKVWHNVADWTIIALIVFSSLEVFLSTFEGAAERYGNLLQFIDIFTTIVFTIEVSLRIWVADLMDEKYKGFWGRVRYCLSFYGLLDFLSTYPFYLGLFVKLPISALKILRVARLLRIFRYLKSFRILGKAISSKKQELTISFAFLSILTIILSFLLYFAEHDAQPDLCENGWKTLVWAFAKYLGDPGKIADFPLLTFWGHVIAAIVGVLGIAIFAVPAGLVGSGFVETLESEKAEKKIHEDGERISEMMLVKSIKREGLFFPAKNISYGDLNLDLGLTNEEILKAVTEFRTLRVKNLSAAITDGPKTDMLVVNQFVVNTDYGSNIDRNSSVTIVNPLGKGDNGLSYFTWHIAELGGFNYVGNELFSRFSGDASKRCNFYTIGKDNELCPEFNKFINDIAEGRGKDEWIIVIAGEQVVKNAETDFHFNSGAEKDSDTFDCSEHLVLDLCKVRSLFEDFASAMEVETGLKTDAHKIQPTLQRSNMCFYLRARTEANILMINVSYRLMIFDPQVHKAILTAAKVFSRNLENRKPAGIHSDNYRQRPIDSEYWRNLYC